LKVKKDFAVNVPAELNAPRMRMMLRVVNSYIGDAFHIRRRRRSSDLRDSS
jgi:hypothetical protein